MNGRLMVTTATLCGIVAFTACSGQSPLAPGSLETSLARETVAPASASSERSLAGGIGASAAQSPNAAAHSTEPMRAFGTGVLLSGTSTLVRNDNGISMTIHANELLANHVYTAWIVAFNDPAGCTDGVCDVEDVLNNRGVPAVRYGGGHVIGQSGQSNIGGRLQAGNTGGPPCAPGPALGSCGPGLLEPRTAEIHLVLRTHGPAIPALVSEQTSSFNGGCPPNACANVQFAAHQP